MCVYIGARLTCRKKEKIPLRIYAPLMVFSSYVFRGAR